MSRGNGMTVTRRRSNSPKKVDPVRLANSLPANLSTLSGVDSTDDYRKLYSAVRDHLEQSVPGQGMVLANPVMKAAGMTAGDFYRKAFNAP